MQLTIVLKQLYPVTDPTADRTITLFNATGTVSLIDATETLTNKTLTAPTVTNGVFNTAVSGTVVKDEDDMSSDSATVWQHNKVLRHSLKI